MRTDDEPEIIRLPMGLWCVRYQRVDNDGFLTYSVIAYGKSREEAISEFNKGYKEYAHG